MAKSKRPTAVIEQYKVKAPGYVHNLMFNVYREPLKTTPMNSKHHIVNGHMEALLTFEQGMTRAEATLYKLPLVSVWLDETNQESVKVCKAHAFVPSIGDTIDGFTDKDIANANELAEYLFSYGQMEVFTAGTAKSRALSIDDFKTIVRYGAGHDVRGKYAAQDPNTYRPVFFYDNKAQLLTSIIETLESQIRGYQVAGMDLINFNLVSDDLLQQFGYTKIPDRLGVGPSMWSGSPHDLLGESTTYRYEGEGAGPSSNEIADSFFELLGQELSEEGVSSGK